MMTGKNSRGVETMTKIVLIEGMKCAGCVTIVKEKFEAIKGVTAVRVNLEKNEATITSQDDIPLSLLEEALADTKFVVS